MNIDYQYYVCHGGQRWLVLGLAEAMVSIQRIRIAQIDTKTHLPTELILHSLPFGCFLFSLSALSISLFIQLTFERGEVTCPGALICMCVRFFFFPNKAKISSVTFVDWRVTSSYIFSLSLSPSLFPSLPPACEIDCPFVGSTNGAGEQIWSSAGSSSSAEMLLGREVGQSQKLSPHSPSVLVTLRPRRASQRANGWRNRPACLGSQLRKFGRQSGGEVRDPWPSS